MFSSLAASKSPELQERENREAERATDRTNAEAARKIEASEREAERQRQRDDGGGRER